MSIFVFHGDDVVQQLVKIISLFVCPRVTHFGFCSFGSDLSPLSLFLLFPPLLGALFNGICQGLNFGVGCILLFIVFYYKNILD
jgi:hypothetical protein